MIGSLTIDKSSSNLSYFLKSIKIIADNGGTITRPDFVSQMATFMGTYAERDGKENRTPYNKLKLVQYFGFATISPGEESSILSLTPRGTILSTLIEEDLTEEDPEQRYYIQEDNVSIVRQLFIDSIFYDSFGRQNCGAERSASDTEPTKVIVKLLAERGLSTSDEIFYAIYSLNGGKDGLPSKCLVWNDILKNINDFRDTHKSYEPIFSSWDLTNFVKDPKILNLLSNPCVDVIRKYEEEYNLSPEIESQFLDKIRDINVYYSPLCEQIISQEDVEDVKEWTLNTVVNKFPEDDSLLFIDLKKSDEFRKDLENFVLKATSFPKKNFHIVLLSNDTEDVWTKFGPYQSLLLRNDSVISERNGWSLNSVTGYRISRFPANLHIVSIICK